MAQLRNRRSAADLFSGFDKTLRETFLDRPRAYWHELRTKFENLAETNFQLGCQFAAAGQWFDAHLRFRFTIYLRPDYAQAHYNLGCCYLQLGKRSKAYDSLMKALRLDPAHREARFMLSGLAPNSLPKDQLPQHMPSDMIINFFTQVAPDYDRLADVNEYQGPRLVAEACKPFLTKTQGLHLVDLGCGSGLVARPWRGLCREILGVDITPAMVALAQVARAGDNPAFDRVTTDDINKTAPGTFMPGASDAVLCIDTAQFLGDLAPVVKLAAAALNNGGLFVITIEPYAAPHGYGVNPDTSRFGHTVEYVRSVANEAGFELKRDGRVPLYTNVVNHLFVFGKRAA